MKKIITAVMFVPAALVFSGCKSNQKKGKEDLSGIKKIVEDNPGLNAGSGTYSISAPEGWSKKDTVISGLRLTAITSPLEGATDNFRENLNVITEEVKGYGLDAYTDANRKNMEAQGMEFLTKGETTLGGERAKWLLYTTRYSGYDLKNTVYFTVKNDIGYVITCSALKSKFDQYQPDFKNCVNSFMIKD